MIDDVFVFDGVAHIFNFEKKNAFGMPGEMFSNHLYAFHTALTPDAEPKLPAEEFLRQWTVADISQMVYDESDNDMLVAMQLPLIDMLRDGLSTWRVCCDLGRRRTRHYEFLGSMFSH